MNAFKTLLAGAALAASATAGNAAVYYADKVIDSDYGYCTGTTKQCTVNDRNTDTNALGASDGAFYSLGFGGSIILGFAESLFPAGTVSALEITFNRPSSHKEAAEIFTLDSAFNIVESLGIVENEPDGAGSKKATKEFTYIKLVDVTKSFYGTTTSYDGYDVDSVSIAPVPLPAAGVLMLAGLGGFAALRRRKNAA